MHHSRHSPGMSNHQRQNKSDIQPTTHASLKAAFCLRRRRHLDFRSLEGSAILSAGR